MQPHAPHPLNILIKSVGYLVFGVFILTSSDAYAQQEQVTLSQDERKSLGELFGTYTSATATFTGLDSISSGRISIDPGDRREKSKVSTLRLPYTHEFGDQNATVRPIGKFVLGHFDGSSSDHTFSDEIAGVPNTRPDFSHDQATSLTLGAGMKIKILKNLFFTPAFDVIWTHIKRMWDYNNELSKAFVPAFDRELFNTSLEAISYAPSAKLAYSIAVNPTVTINPSIKYTHLKSRDLWSKSTLADFSIDSGIFQTSVETSIKTPWCLMSLPMGLHPFITRTDLSGGVYDGMGVKHFYDLGNDFSFDVTRYDSFIKEVSIGGSYLFGDNFEGFRVGLGLTF